MNAVRSFFIALASVILIAVLTASVSLFVIGLLTVSLLARAFAPRLQTRPVYARSRNDKKQGTSRIWNDGRGTIIDL
jgi:hypothetical protein